ncbi:maleylpyruvate isomerase N-terminal domain-containing protein [Streptomyces sp. NPDC048665]|uniref:maleylpyruvate isomerase N-terminal domain-containing protein n=1 Tax=unclassified Streptomyces TaxID=2593676 RepID=UPI001D4E33CD|nr:maleylpyruvate isomerase N-terminal domain-containing protein [Streptomyces sp. tea 10]
MTAPTRPAALPPGRYTAELRREAARFAGAARAIPLSEPVPACPGWTLGDLVRHVRQGHDWATTILATRSTEFILPGGDLSGAPDEDRSWTERVAELGARGGALEGRLADPELRARFVVEGADRLVEAIDGVGPEVPVWAPHGRQNKEFWPRWAVFETAVHRADVYGMAGLPFTPAAEVALDCVDFCLAAFGVPEARPFLSPLFAEVPRGGQTLCFRSTRESAYGPSSWLVTCAAGGVEVTREIPAGTRADATVVAAPADLLLVVKGRLRPGSPRVTVRGDRELLDFWLSHAVS